jgi:hypothetical protein
MLGRSLATPITSTLSQATAPRACLVSHSADSVTLELESLPNVTARVNVDLNHNVTVRGALNVSLATNLTWTRASLNDSCILFEGEDPDPITRPFAGFCGAWGAAVDVTAASYAAERATTWVGCENTQPTDQTRPLRWSLNTQSPDGSFVQWNSSIPACAGFMSHPPQASLPSLRFFQELRNNTLGLRFAAQRQPQRTRREGENQPGQTTTTATGSSSQVLRSTQTATPVRASVIANTIQVTTIDVDDDAVRLDTGFSVTGMSVAAPISLQVGMPSNIRLRETMTSVFTRVRFITVIDPDLPYSILLPSWSTVRFREQISIDPSRLLFNPYGTGDFTRYLQPETDCSEGAMIMREQASRTACLGEEDRTSSNRMGQYMTTLDVPQVFCRIRPNDIALFTSEPQAAISVRTEPSWFWVFEVIVVYLFGLILAMLLFTFRGVFFPYALTPLIIIACMGRLHSKEQNWTNSVNLELVAQAQRFVLSWRDQDDTCKITSQTHGEITGILVAYCVLCIVALVSLAIARRREVLSVLLAGTVDVLVTVGVAVVLTRMAYQSERPEQFFFLALSWALSIAILYCRVSMTLDALYVQVPFDYGATWLHFVPQLLAFLLAYILIPIARPISGNILLIAALVTLVGSRLFFLVFLIKHEAIIVHRLLPAVGLDLLLGVIVLVSLRLNWHAALTGILFLTWTAVCGCQCLAYKFLFREPPKPVIGDDNYVYSGHSSAFHEPSVMSSSEV